MVIPVGLQYGAPEIAFYGGLSGIDSAIFGLMVAWTFRDSLAERNWVTALVTALFAVGFMAKVSFEMYTDSTIFVEAGGDMVGVPLAHILGALVGLAVGLWPRRIDAAR